MTKSRRWILVGIVMTITLATIWLQRPGRVELTGAQPGTAQGQLELGIKAFQRLELGDAISALQRAVELNPGSVPAHYLLAQALEAAGRTKDALRAYEQTVQMAPSLAAPRYNLAVLHRLEGSTTRMEEELKEAVRLSPQFTAAHLLLGTLFYGRNRWDQALTELTAAAEQPTAVIADRSALHLMLGNILAQLGRHQEAVQQWRAVLALDPANSEANRLLRTSPGQGGNP